MNLGDTSPYATSPKCEILNIHLDRQDQIQATRRFSLKRHTTPNKRNEHSLQELLRCSWNADDKPQRDPIWASESRCPVLTASRNLYIDGSCRSLRVFGIMATSACFQTADSIQYSGLPQGGACDDISPKRAIVIFCLDPQRKAVDYPILALKWTIFLGPHHFLRALVRRQRDASIGITKEADCHHFSFSYIVNSCLHLVGLRP